MHTERSINFREDVHNQALAEAVALAQNHPEAKAFLVIDVDDVRDDTRLRYVRKMNWVLRRRHPYLQDKLPTMEEGRKISIGGFYKPLLGDTYYKHVWGNIESRASHFKNVSPAEPDMKERLEDLINAGYIPILWLTARFSSMTQVTREEGVKKGLPNLPVYAMYPEDDDIVGMKMDALTELQEKLNKPLIMIDDNPKLIQHLDNAEMGIQGVLYETPRFPDTQTRRKAVWSTMLEKLQSENE